MSEKKIKKVQQRKISADKFAKIFWHAVEHGILSEITRQEIERCRAFNWRQDGLIVK